jgi:uncharacterized phage protein (TIGR01671 family)
MREILYRGKLLHNGEWVYGNYLSIETTAYIYPAGSLVADGHHVMQSDEGAFWIDPETRGEYTGLTDKKGRKIFDGDIVRYGYKDWDETEKAIVQWKGASGYPAFDLDRHNFDGNALAHIFQSGDYEIEVIGNIHDNPELLEGNDSPEERRG